MRAGDRRAAICLRGARVGCAGLLVVHTRMDDPQQWRSRCGRLAVHLRKSVTSHRCVAADDTSAQRPRYIDEAGRVAFGAELRRLFGLQASCSGPLAASGLGWRLTGVDLVGAKLSPEQATFLLDAVARFGIVCIAGQDLERFTLQDFERLANHWGAPYPHPSNFTRDGVLASEHGPTEGEVEWVPFADRRASGVNRAFPGELQCLPHESPAVLIASNVSSGRGETKGDGAPGLSSAQDPIKTGGGNWHTDIECKCLGHLNTSDIVLVDKRLTCHRMWRRRSVATQHFNVFRSSCTH